MNEYVQVVTTVDDEAKAGEISSLLLERRLVACVQIIGPIASSGWWKGKVQKTTEWMCLAKAKTEDFERIRSAIEDIHPYEVPEIVAVPIYFGNPSYLSWISETTDVPQTKNESSTSSLRTLYQVSE